MLSRGVLSRGAVRDLAQPCRARTCPRRGLAAAASGSYTYESGTVGGIKYASRDLPGPTTTLAIVAKAGTRFFPPVVAEVLERFAFKVGLDPGYRPSTAADVGAEHGAAIGVADHKRV